ncbi:DNA-binding protein [Vibrio sp. ZSDZ65]|uniref:DNA-binding protein n=1 Tax=Vibrio qingdaonensis TaxID=2829491 RepID=A0A9X3CT47_9VIBR|nr:DNA-binding protein [Vibrio qingdaonensis]MCW8349051.1 DNA-binding protein [Vibrio qingdaonensis]
MARDRSFTDNDIIDAVRQLNETGRNINKTSLRSVIGKGRPATLYSTYTELLEQGKIEQELSLPAEPESKTHELPPEISEIAAVVLSDIEAMIHRVNDAAHNIVEGRLNKAIENAKAQSIEAGERVQSIEQELEVAYNTIEDSNEALEQKDNKIINLERSESSLQSQVQNLNNKLLEREDRIIGLNEEVSRLGALTKTLEESLSQIRTSLAAKHASLEATEKENSELSKKVIKLEKDLSSSGKKVANVEGQLEVKEKQLVELKQELIDEKSQHQVTAGELSATNISLGVTNQNLDEANTRIRELANKNVTLEDRNTELLQAKENLVSVTNENTTLAGAVEQLKKELADEKTRVETLVGKLTSDGESK